MTMCWTAPPSGARSSGDTAFVNWMTKVRATMTYRDVRLLVPSDCNLRIG